MESTLPFVFAIQSPRLVLLSTLTLQMVHSGRFKMFTKPLVTCARTEIVTLTMRFSQQLLLVKMKGGGFTMSEDFKILRKQHRLGFYIKYFGKEINTKGLFTIFCVSIRSVLLITSCGDRPVISNEMVQELSSQLYMRGKSS